MNYKFEIGEIVRNEISASPERLSNGNTIAVVTDIYTNGKQAVYETEYLTDEDGEFEEVEEPYFENIVYETSLEKVRDGFDYYDDDGKLKAAAAEIIKLNSQIP